MKSTEALRVLAELTSYQWGMVTSAQASMRGVTRLDLSRLADSGHLIRLAHGVYMDAGAPGDEFDDLRAAWLSTEPKRLGELRINDQADGVIIAGESATRLHRIGDFRALQHDFTSPVRRQSQRREIRYRQRALDPRDVTLRQGLPVMTIERTIADLVEDLKDLSLVADVLRDASGERILDLDRLRELLAPLAERNGFRKGDGGAVLNRLMELAGIDIESLAHRVAADPFLGARVAADFVGRMSKTGIDKLLVTPQMEKTLRSIQEAFAKTLHSAMASQMEGLNAASAGAFSTLAKSSEIEEMARKMSEQLVSSDAMKEFSRSWTKSLADSLTLSPETLALARTAQRAASNG
ncbi:MAG: type IV toxin-antitoxin system AbiEi family antitoxin domain-containing protein [Actinomycetia bacterium]|nr:type IV toxin-antitoxin system AbiEi family antitoxin domain-containing protein [Actinomycetes bacterium]